MSLFILFSICATEAIRRGAQGEKPQALQARRLHGEPCAGIDCHAGRGREILFTACLDERASTGVFEKTSRGRERGIIPLEQRAHLYTLAGVCALPRAYLRTGNFPRAPIWRLCRNKGLHPLRRLRGYPCTPTKTVHPPLASVPFLRVWLSYPGGDTHSHLPL